MEPEEVESVRIGDLAISVPKLEADFVRSMGFSSFCYVSCEEPVLDKVGNQNEKTTKPKKEKKVKQRKASKEAAKHVESMSLKSRSKSITPKPDPISKPKPKIEDKKFRSQVRQTIGDQLFKRCHFHDIDIAQVRCRELAFQIELGLVDFIHNIKDQRYRQWCTMFVKHLMNCGKPFLDKILVDRSIIRHLTKLFDKDLYNELQRLDEIEAAEISTGNLIVDESEPCTSSSLTESAAVKEKSQLKVKPVIELPFKMKLSNEPNKVNRPLPSVPIPVATSSHGRSAIDDILGDAKDTTSKHMSHLFDANCEICIAKSKRQAALLEKEREKEKLRAERPKKNHRQPVDQRNTRSNTSPNCPSNGRYASRNSKRFHEKRRWDISPIRRASSPISNRGESPDVGMEPLPPGNSPPPTFSAPLADKRKRHAEPSSWRIPTFTTTNNEVPAPIVALDVKRRQLCHDNARYESWRNNRLHIVEPNPLLEQVIWSGRIIYPANDVLNYKCDFIAIRNRSAAANIDNELPRSLEVKGIIEQQSVWSYLRNLRENTDNQIVTLLMHPPPDDVEYKEYVIMYNDLLNGERMGVVNVEGCSSIKDMYIFSLRSGKSLHPLCDRGDGPGLMPEVQKCGNILAVIVRKEPMRLESWKQSWVGSHSQVNDTAAPPLTPPPLTLGRYSHENGESFRVEMSSNSLDSPRPLVICSPEEVAVAKHTPPLTLTQLDEIVNLVENSPTHEPASNNFSHKIRDKVANPEELERRQIEAQILAPQKMPSNFEHLRLQLHTLKFSRNVFLLATAFFNGSPVDHNEHMEVIRIADSKNKLPNTNGNESPPPPPPPPVPLVEMAVSGSPVRSSATPDNDFILPPPPPPPPLQQPAPQMIPSNYQMHPVRPLYEDPPMNVRPLSGPNFFQNRKTMGPPPFTAMFSPTYGQAAMNGQMRPTSSLNFPLNGPPINLYNAPNRPTFRQNGLINIRPEAMSSSFHQLEPQLRPVPVKLRTDQINNSFRSLEPQRRPELMNGNLLSGETHPRAQFRAETFHHLEPQRRPQLIRPPTRGLLLPQPRAGPMQPRPRLRMPRLDSGGFYR